MYCSKCGKVIDDEAMICPGCGAATANYRKDRYEGRRDYAQRPAPITVVNNNNVYASAAIATGRIRHRRSVLFDILMICITGGLWIIWMIFRPKYY
ncbi:MAG: zinc ribbon domain-containing protein [Oscillospiraceae bacterium]|nr:zinc ribbon domain-containing protein [Oscillospiraceae bacterium]